MTGIGDGGRSIPPSPIPVFLQIQSINKPLILWGIAWYSMSMDRICRRQIWEAARGDQAG